MQLIYQGAARDESRKNLVESGETKKASFKQAIWANGLLGARRKRLLLLLTLLASNGLWAATLDDFITTWKTDNVGASNDDQITIPTEGAGYNYDILWGDGQNDMGVTGSITHTYAAAGTYTVTIRGDFPRIYFNNTGDEEKILSVEQWGTIAWTSMNKAFYGCTNLLVNATDAPDLSAVTDASSMFFASSLNSSLDHWDVSNITNMSLMFASIDAFNQPLGTWDVSRVTDMGSMFYSTDTFNQPIGTWDVSSVTDMGNMFTYADEFNQPINSWNVSSVTDMGGMFYNADAFNPRRQGSCTHFNSQGAAEKYSCRNIA